MCETVFIDNDVDNTYNTYSNIWKLNWILPNTTDVSKINILYKYTVQLIYIKGPIL